MRINCITLLSFFLWAHVVWGYQQTVVQRIDHLYEKQEKVWVNVQSYPEWRGGPKPQLNALHKRYDIKLEPGQSMLMALPAMEYLKCSASITKMKFLEVWQSDDFGIEKRLKLGDDLKQESLQSKKVLKKFRKVESHIGEWLFQSNVNHTTMIRFVWPKDQKESIVVPAYISRTHGIRRESFIREIEIDDKAYYLNRQGDERLKTFYELKEGEKAEIRLEKNNEYEIEMLYCYQPLQKQNRSDFRVQFFETQEKESFAVLEYDCQILKRSPYYINGQLLASSSIKRAVIQTGDSDLPIVMRSNARILFRILGPAQHQYRWKTNRSNKPGLNSRESHQSYWDADDDSLLSLQETAKHLSEIIPLANRIARDNQWKEGGLIAYQMVLQRAREQNEPNLYRLASKLYSRYTYFSECAPFQYSTEDALARYSFITMKIGEESRKRWLYSMGLEESLKALNSGFFYKTQKNQELDFQIKQSPFNRSLRLSIAHASLLNSTNIKLVFENGKTIYLKTRTPTDMERGMLESSTKEAMKLLWIEQERRADLFPFGDRAQKPAEYVESSSIVIDIPKHVGSFKLYSDDSVLINAAIRRAKVFRLSPANYISTVRMYETERPLFQLFRNLIQGQDSRSYFPSVRNEAYELSNHWSAIDRFIRNRAQNFSALNFAPLNKAGNKTLSKQQRKEYRIKADALFKNKNYLHALQYYTNLANDEDGEDRLAAVLKKISCLEYLGESKLAFHLARYELFHLKNKDQREKVRSWIDQYYSKDENLDGRLSLACHELVHAFSKEGMHHLAHLFMESGFNQYALDLLKLFPQDYIETQLELSLSLGDEIWFFDRLIHLGKRDQAQWLQRYKLYKGISEQLNDINDRSEDDDQYDLKGLQLAKELKAQKSLSEEMLINWSLWQNTPKIKRSWRNHDHALDHHFGSLTVHNPILNLNKTYYRVCQSKPVRYRLLGTKDVRLEIRVLHVAQDERVNGNIKIIQNSNETASLRVDSELSQSSLNLVGKTADQLGQKITREFKVFPGDTFLEIRSDIPILVSLSAKQPQIANAIMPTLNHRVAHVHAEKKLPFENDMVSLSKKRNILCLSPKRMWPKDLGLEPWAMLIENEIEIPHAEHGRRIPIQDKGYSLDVLLSPVGMNQGRRAGRDMPTSFQKKKALNQDNKIELNPVDLFTKSLKSEGIIKHKKGLDKIKPRLVQWMAISRRYLENNAYGKNGLDELVGTWGLYDYLQAFSKHIAQEPKVAQKWLMHILKLESFHQFKQDEKRVYLECLRHIRWKFVESVDQRAGFKTLELKGWQPESERSRLWKSLLDIHPEAFVLGSQKNILIPIKNKKEERFTIRVRLLTPEFLPLAPVDFTIRINEKKRTFQLDGKKQDLQFEEALGAGNHSIYFETGKAGLGQYVEIRIDEHFGDAFSGELLMNANKRSYHVATQDEPLVYQAHDEVVLRVISATDPYHPSERLVFLKEGESLELTSKSDEMLYRLYEMEYKYSPPDFSEDRGQFEKIQIAAVPDHELEFKYIQVDSASLATRKLTQLGSIELLGRYAKRDGYLGDDEEEDRDSEEYFQGGLSFRYKSARYKHYYRSDAFFREYTKALPIFYSLRQKVDMKDLPYDLEFGLRYQFNTQKFSNEHRANVLAVPGRERSNYLGVSLSKRFPLTERLSFRSKVSVHQRWMSLNRPESRFLQRVDPDIYSNYKDNHKRYLSIREQFNYKIRQDLRFQGLVGLNTNEDYNPTLPDTFYAGLNTRMQIGEFDVKGGYLFRVYRNDPQRSKHSLVNRFDIGVHYDRWLKKKFFTRLGLKFILAPEDDKYSILFDVNVFPFFRGDYYNHNEGDPSFIQLKRRRFSRGR